MTKIEPLPVLVLVALSRAGIIDSHSFAAVLAAFGPLPAEGQLELADRLIETRRMYAINMRSKHDREDLPFARRERLDEIGPTAERLRKLLHRDGTEPQPWNLHPAVSREFPALYRIVTERHDPAKMAALEAAGLAEPARY
jgi:hypothetical protein